MDTQEVKRQSAAADSTTMALTHSVSSTRPRPMRLPFRILAGILAFGILVPMTVSVALDKPFDSAMFLAFGSLSALFSHLAITGRTGPWA